MLYRRKEGFYAKRSGGYLVLYPYSSFQPIVLHPSSVLLYSLIDGSTKKVDLYQNVKGLVDPTTVPSDADLEAAFQQLLEFGLIEQVYSDSLSSDFISVSFVGFWDSFNPSKNYFLEALSTRFVPIIVDQTKETPSIIFIGDEGGIDQYNHLTQDNISVGVHSVKNKTTQNTFDFNIYTNGGVEDENSVSIPIWAVHFTWIKHFTNSTPDHHLFELEAFSPKNCGGKIFTFLNSYVKEEPSTSNENYFINTQENLARITNFSSIQKGKLTIGMATYDDYDGVYFTLQSIRLYHGEILDKLQFIIIDNNPTSVVGEAIKKFVETIPHCKYIPFSAYKGTSIRDLFFREANTEYVMSIDSHIMIEKGALAKTIQFLDQNPACMDLIQGPIVFDGLGDADYASSFRPEWQEGMYGVWQKDHQAAKAEGYPFEIPMHGLALFACRKEAWLGFNPRFRGFGAEEGYIHEKFRQAGRTTICLPFLRWLHRFGRPEGTKYPNIYEDRIRNYKLAFQEVGWDTATIDHHFTFMLGKENYQQIERLLDKQLRNPLYKIDAVYFLLPPPESDHYEASKNKIKEAGLEYLLRVHHYAIAPSGTPEYEDAQREIVDNAIKYGFKTVMIIQDVVVFSELLFSYLDRIFKNLDAREWACLHIGSDIRSNYISMFDKSLYLPTIHRPPNSHIAAFNLEHIYGLSYQASQKTYVFEAPILESTLIEQ